MEKMKMKRTLALLCLLLALVMLLSSCFGENPYGGTTEITTTEQNKPIGPITGIPEGNEIPALTKPTLNLSSIPAYTGSPYTPINQNLPQFNENQYTTQSYEYYSALDSLGRCGIAVACVGIDLMPTEPRDSISSITPSGWNNKEYSTDLVENGWIYNRCHLIGFQLTGENANKNNLITGTRSFNVDGMLPFENMIADYVKETENHVLFRVTPIYNGNDLVASGVQMEAYSIEDAGEGVSFNVYVYNVQDGIEINYANGDNWLSGSYVPPADGGNGGNEQGDYVLNTSSKKIHRPTCYAVEDIAAHNKQTYTGTLDALYAQGYTGCGHCDP